jgi:hypothetical protein
MKPMKPNLFDRLIYRLWYWRWNQILASRPDLRRLFVNHLESFNSKPVKLKPMPHPLYDNAHNLDKIFRRKIAEMEDQMN